MNNLHDLLLVKDLGNNALEFLLFSSFSLHLMFVLLMLGTAMIAVFFFIHSWFTGYRFELRWDKRVLRHHLSLKSLAVVLGVAPLLLIQVLWSVPFLTAASILAPYWLALTGLMIFAFLSLDTLGHKIEVHPVRHLFFGVVGLAALIAIPAVFTAVLTILENPDRWSAISAHGLSADPGLVFHWLIRYLHILGAAALLGGAYHYFFSTAGHEERHYHLSHWMVVAILFQVVVGVLLLTSVLGRLTPAVITAVMVGVLTSMLLMGLLFYGNPKAKPARMKAALVLLPVIFVSMLLARQMLQHQVVAPFQAELEAKADTQAQQLKPFRQAAFQRFERRLDTVYDNGETIYDRACAFCHGAKGNGNGIEAGGLIVPPERLDAVRARRSYLYQQLINGVPGSGMPYFSIFDRHKLQSLLDHLEQRFSITQPASAPDQRGDTGRAATVFANTCARCHGKQGRVSDFGQNLSPPPPDLSAYSLTAKRVMEVITNGYTGTVMQPFSHLPKATRQGLVTYVQGLHDHSREN